MLRSPHVLANLVKLQVIDLHLAIAGRQSLAGSAQCMEQATPQRAVYGETAPGQPVIENQYPYIDSHTR